MRWAWPLWILLIVVSSLTVGTSQQRSPTRDRAHISQDYWDELLKGMNRMHRAVTSLEPSGNADDDFANLMLPHHQAAIDMAKVELLYGEDPQMRRLAQEIIADQQSEIELMQLWLERSHAH